MKDNINSLHKQVLINIKTCLRALRKHNKTEALFLVKYNVEHINNIFVQNEHLFEKPVVKVSRLLKEEGQSDLKQDLDVNCPLVVCELAKLDCDKPLTIKEEKIEATNGIFNQHDLDKDSIHIDKGADNQKRNLQNGISNYHEENDFEEDLIHENEETDNQQENLTSSHYSEINCEICDSKIISDGSEDPKFAHMATYHFNKVFVCECGQYFYEDDNKLELHEREYKHVTEKMCSVISCPHCNLKFLDGQGLLSAIAIHFITKKNYLGL